MEIAEELRSLEFETARGIKVKFCEMDHSHLCNLIYYKKYINTQNSKMADELAYNELMIRFKGRMLQYEPKYAFEVRALQAKGMLIPNEKGEFDIMDAGKKIGIVKKMAILSNL